MAAAWELPLFKLPALVAGADLSNSYGLAVKLNASGQVVLCVANEFPIGVVQDKPKQGQPAEVWHLGVVRAIAGAAVATAALVATDAAGKFVTATTGQKVVGQALTPASAANSHFSLLLLPGTVAP